MKLTSFDTLEPEDRPVILEDYPYYSWPKQTKVKGPLSCEAHGCDCNFIFDYEAKRYKHVHKNGGICSSSVHFVRY